MRWWTCFSLCKQWSDLGDGWIPPGYIEMKISILWILNSKFSHLSEGLLIRLGVGSWRHTALRWNRRRTAFSRVTLTHLAADWRSVWRQRQPRQGCTLVFQGWRRLPCQGSRFSATVAWRLKLIGYLDTCWGILETEFIRMTRFGAGSGRTT